MTCEDASKSVPESAQLSDDIHVLEAEIATLTLEVERTKQRIRDLMADEDPVAGISHHQDIFQAQQDKLRMEVEVKFRQNKINRIRLGVDAGDVQGAPADGFLF
ncbi:hypothetical protein [Pseudodesulfovibrio senegalensis]|jgi:ABC-type sugar transport system ATPase subunit|uniref:Uncharacterized protein n=1 Tax=Pseudodesulfovibrio senegalensis TaxID=1721087 RepID=A0A6N6N3H5_9BACT|nr:hypothetical protein [Pseudodesulfovibrio senegalensis]KAB1442742.1 hypothetical protein F8A88_00230 [Pseudodesulfovibrio senegalensis]